MEEEIHLYINNSKLDLLIENLKDKLIINNTEINILFIETNYVQIIIKNIKLFDDICNFMDEYIIKSPELRYQINLFTKNKEYPYRIHINKQNKKIITKNASKLISICNYFS